MNQLKYQATKSKELQKDLEKGLEFKSELQNVLDDFKKRPEEIKI